MLDEQTAANIITFLMRSDMKGHEAFAFVECVQKFRAFIDEQRAAQVPEAVK